MLLRCLALMEKNSSPANKGQGVGEIHSYPLCCDMLCPSLNPGATRGWYFLLSRPVLLPSVLAGTRLASVRSALSLRTAGPPWSVLLWYLLSLDMWHTRLHIPSEWELCFVIYLCSPGIWGPAQNMFPIHLNNEFGRTAILVISPASSLSPGPWAGLPIG